MYLLLFLIIAYLVITVIYYRSSPKITILQAFKWPYDMLYRLWISALVEQMERQRELEEQRRERR